MSDFCRGFRKGFLASFIWLSPVWAVMVGYLIWGWV